MSSFTKNTFNPKTGKFEGAFWLDDYFGPHHYGVVFRDGTLVDPEKIPLETNDKRHYLTWNSYLPRFLHKEYKPDKEGK